MSANMEEKRNQGLEGQEAGKDFADVYVWVEASSERGTAELSLGGISIMGLAERQAGQLTRTLTQGNRLAHLCEKKS